jgi:nucleoside-diphosphate-sugar epimerase
MRVAGQHSGVVGRHAVAVLREGGHDVRVLARSTGVDVTTGQGLDVALEGLRRCWT